LITCLFVTITGIERDLEPNNLKKKPVPEEFFPFPLVHSILIVE
jgi:hypothetical protein